MTNTMTTILVLELEDNLLSLNKSIFKELCRVEFLQK